MTLPIKKWLLLYADMETQYGTVIVGTVSGNSISFGSPVVFNPAYYLFTSSTFDSTNNKVVIAYQDNGNNYYGTVIAGTVSGNSINLELLLYLILAILNYF